MKNIQNIFTPILRPVSIAATLMKLAAVPIGIINAGLMSDVVNAAVSGDCPGVVRNSIFILSVLLAVKLFDVIAGYAYRKKSSDALHSCKMLLYKRYLSSPLNVLYRSAVGETNVLLNSDFGTVTQKYVGVYPTLISAAATVAAYFVYLCARYPALALIMAAVSLVQILPPLYVRLFCERLDNSGKDMEGQISNCALECYNGFATIKLFDLGSLFLDRMKRLHRKMERIANKLQATYRAETAISGIVSNVLTYGTYAIVGLFVITEHITVDDGVRAIALSGGLYTAVSSMFGLIPELELVRTAEKRMARFCGEERENTMELSDEPSIRFDNVSCLFGDTRVLSDASFVIDPDRITVFRGVNGAGKSTIVRLALGMTERDGGDIRIGGISPEQIGSGNFPRKIFYLTQDDPTYNLTPGELFDIVLGEQGSERAFAVLDMFATGGEILSQTVGSLSGGERKKVFLSLAFACESRLMILDEPTNSLDRSGCEVLYRLLRERGGGCVIITHEEELIELASTVYEVRDGRVIYER